MAMIHPDILASVFAVIVDGAGQQPNKQGSGFIIARPDNMTYNPWKREEDSGSNNWHFYGVTCKHVVEGKIPDNNRHGILIRTSRKGEDGKVKYNNWTTTEKEWYLDYEEDIAVVNMTSYLVATNPTTQIFAWKPETQLLRQAMNEKSVWEGNPVMMIGFPQSVGMRTDTGQHPLVRQGIIALARPYLEGVSNTFLIDGSAFGGNSGGPVITIPTILSVGGTQTHTESSLIGMVCASSQSERQEGWWDGEKLHRLKETSGLGVVVGVEPIHRTIDKYILTKSSEQRAAEISRHVTSA